MAPAVASLFEEAVRQYHADRLSEAAQLLGTILATNPQHAGGMYLLGLIASRAGRMDDAVALFARALREGPENPWCHYSLARALHTQGKPAEALPHYEHALALIPDHAEAHYDIGVALTQLGRFDDAANHYQSAVAAKPDHADAHNNLAGLRKGQGRFAEALAHLSHAIEARPDYAEAHYNRAEIMSFHPGDAELDALETLARRDDLPPHRAMHVQFALAKALDDVGEYPRAFTHLRRANELKRGQIAYDESATREIFERIACVFDRGLLERARSEAVQGDASPVPVFVLGMPRSGSTLIEQILDSHPQAQAAGELNALEHVAAGIAFPECMSNLDASALGALGRSYLQRLPALAEGKLRIVDKLPHNFLRIGLIRLILPHAKIIHTVRNPIDTCLSCYSKLFVGNLEFMYNLEELGRYYQLYSGLMAHWRSVLAPGETLEVAYEDVVNDLEGQARRLIDYCGLPWDDRCLDFHNNNRPVGTASSVQVRQPLYRTSLQRWRRYESDLAPLLAIIGE